MSRLPVVVVGEALVDIVVPTEGEPTAAVGGSPLNVAVGLARLGVPALLITRVGDDEHGRWISDHVRESGAELSTSSVVAGTTTSTATAHLDEDRAARYEFELVWDLDHHALPEARALHVGSLGAALLPGRHAVVDLVRQAEETEMFVSYDPNIRPAFVTDREATWRDVKEIAGHCRLVKISDEDIAVLRPGVPLEDVARELLDGGTTELVVVTRGPDGATAYAPVFTVHEPAPPTGLVDTVGAGDSFMAALLAILDEWDLPTDGPGALDALDADHVSILLRGAMTAASVTVSRRGANPPTRQELPPTWPL
ncbi:MAG TPA: carbohydrate kinase [Nocardioidaceae bacterium]|nr:carbohydrate kinase [Nocardioidaceae bacterium]